MSVPCRPRYGDEPVDSARLDEIRTLVDSHRFNEIGAGWRRADELARALQDLIHHHDTSKEAA